MSNRSLCTLLVFLYCLPLATAQGYVDQDKVARLQNSQLMPVDNLQKVSWHLYEYGDHVKGDSLGNWGEFLAHIDSIPGDDSAMKRYIVELTNRITGDNFKNGRALMIPDSFVQDFKAYSPYPFYYTAADTVAKLFIIDKFTQTFGAYEYGKLVRWGLLSSGRTNDKTPAGRYNFNWKDEYRLSNAAPPGEKWELFFMFDFQAIWGLHVHQYSLPINKPVSHGCVRVSMADAKWNYNWANGWVHKKGKLVRNGTPVMIIHDNPTGNAAHWKITDGKIESLVILPEHLLDIPAGLHSTTSAVPWQSGW
ncbi:MAG: L,D-transpeptidase [Chitinophagaceae bacterium]|nr:L,D-transpeptidase [Chitinophagaceae bacterium]MCB9045131.1 L,D-transpeptidase [Chitinophagales bacterium]